MKHHPKITGSILQSKLDEENRARKQFGIDESKEIAVLPKPTVSATILKILRWILNIFIFLVFSVGVIALISPECRLELLQEFIRFKTHYLPF